MATENQIDLSRLGETSVQFETVRVSGVFDRPNDMHHVLLENHYNHRVFYNGLERRTRFEVNNALRVVKEKGVLLDADIYLLPYTILKQNGSPAATAFTEKNPELRHIYLVPDHTPSRVKHDVGVHTDTMMDAVTAEVITRELASKWLDAMNRLTEAERTAASIIHEYGHILTFDAMDACDPQMDDALEAYDWLDDFGYLDNVSNRIVSFSQNLLEIQVNVALEALAEDYRVSFDRKSEADVCKLPSAMTFIQDILHPHLYFEGVEIMAKILKLEPRGKNNLKKSSGNLIDVLPFGEADRAVIAARFSQGSISPLTPEAKQRAREEYIRRKGR